MMDNEEAGQEPQELTYKELLTQINEPFIDEGFPPDQRSLITSESVFKLQTDELEAFKQLDYARLSDIYKGNKITLFDKIDPHSIKQGCLCNSYFLSAISALAENPARIKKCFVSESINKVGCYAVQLYLNGENKTEIIIDDYVPVYKGTNNPAFTTSSNNDVWVQLLEKAWAKSNGGYDKTVFGLSSEVLRSVTGAPVFIYEHETLKPDELWKQLNFGIKSGYAMLCSLEDETYNYEESDSVSNFSYTIIGAYKVNTSKGNVKLIKIRNPWGNFEWNGDWSDSSRLWTKSIKDDVEWQPNSNGVFYMSLEDYQANFLTTVICKIHDAYQYTTSEVKQDIGGNTILKFQINRDQKAFFNLSQLAYRIVPREYGYHPYNAKMILAKLDKENKDFPLQYIDAIVAEKDDIPLEADLIAGEYYLFLRSRLERI